MHRFPWQPLPCSVMLGSVGHMRLASIAFALPVAALESPRVGAQVNRYYIDAIMTKDGGPCVCTRDGAVCSARDATLKAQRLTLAIQNVRGYPSIESNIFKMRWGLAADAFET